MKPETVQRVLQAADEMAQQVGLSSYDDIGDFVRKKAPLVRFVLDFFESMGTRSKFGARLLDQDEPDPASVDFLTRTLHEVPGIFGSAVRDAAKTGPLSPEHRGRPFIAPQKRRDICQFVLDLHGKKGLSERVAKERAVQKFHVSRRSVDRIWQNRVEILNDSEMIQRVFTLFSQIMRGAAQPSQEEKKNEGA